MILLIAIASALAQEAPVPDALVGTGVDTAAWVLDRFGYPGLFIAAIVYMWRTRQRGVAAQGDARWRGIPVIIQLEIPPKTADMLQQVFRGKRLPSAAAKERERARLEFERASLELEHGSSNDDDSSRATPS